MWVDIEASGSITGPGPLMSVQSWRETRKLSRAGEVGFKVPAADSRAGTLIQEQRVARLRGVRNNALVQLGAGIIEDIDLDVSTPGGGSIAATGANLMGELDNTSVGFLSLSNATSGPADIIALMPGWSLDAVAGYTSTIQGVTLQFAGESGLAALVKLSDMTGERFRLAADGSRKIVWLRTDTSSSGVRCIRRGDPSALLNNPDVAVITKLSKKRTSKTLVNRVYVFGAGDGDARLTLASTTRHSAAGAGDYTWSDAGRNYKLHIDATARLSYIEDTTSSALYGAKERHINNPDITPATTGATDIQNAANTVFDWGFEQLKNMAQPQVVYGLAVTKLDKPVDPGQTINVVYRETNETTSYKIIDIDTYRDGALLVLSVTTDIDAGGRSKIVGLEVANLPIQTDETPVYKALVKVAGAGGHAQPATTSGAVSDTTIARNNAQNTFAGNFSQVISRDDSATNTVVNIIKMRHTTSATPANNFGGALILSGDDNGAEDVDAARWVFRWKDVTHATRLAEAWLSVYSGTTEQKGLYMEANGSGIKMAFFGTNPIAKPAVTGSRGGNAALASLLTQLAALGLITDSSTV